MHLPNEIIEKYNSSNKIDRLYLYLSCQEFRKTFTKIELEELHHGKKNQPAFAQRGWLNRFYQFCTGCIMWHQ